MCDYYRCIPSSPVAYTLIKVGKFGLNSHPHASSRAKASAFKFISARASRRNPGFNRLGSEDHGFPGEIKFKEKGTTRRDKDDDDDDDDDDDSSFEFQSRFPISKKKTDSRRVELDILDFRTDKKKKKSEEDEEEEDEDANLLLKSSSSSGLGLGLRRGGRQVIKRSSILAKQVISIQSALALGFVSQLWVDTSSWMVVVVEVRPNLLSGESERFLLQDISQVGDVILVENENVIENGLRMVGLETLVGYRVVTRGRRSIGKVRGYSFNINSGAVESLELDSFGISIIPSSLVSTYALHVEDVLEVSSDAVVVHEAAGSHIQRLTKGFWDAQNVGTSIDDLEYPDSESPVGSGHDQSRSRTFGSEKFHKKIRKTEDDLELPMDYL